jgi:hypothetical protein
VGEKFLIKIKLAIAKHALAVSFLAPRVPMQVGEMPQYRNNLAFNIQQIHCYSILITLSAQKA